MPISETQLSEWRRDGYTVIPSLLTPAELSAVLSDLAQLFPDWDGYALAPQLYSNFERGGCVVEMPFLGAAPNMVSLHPGLIDFAERALGTREILLTQSLVWAKYFGQHDFDQAMHVDYRSSSLLYPSADPAPEQLTVTLYYQDTDSGSGTTCVVPRTVTSTLPLIPDVRTKEQAPELYRSEVPVTAPAGSALLYELRTFHRGTALTRPRSFRLSHHIVFRRADAPWGGYRVWANWGETQEMVDLIERSNIRQRELLGIPQPGNSVWNAESLAGMAMRYPRMDLSPYAEVAGVPLMVLETARKPLNGSPAPHQRADDMTFSVTFNGTARDQLRALWAHSPHLAAYYEGMLDMYEACQGYMEQQSTPALP